jgi:hypothetical protein
MMYGRYEGSTHRLRLIFRKSWADADLQQEIEIHLEQLVKEGVASGMNESEARMMARRGFGPLEKTKEECRDTRRINVIDNFTRDVRYALRMTLKIAMLAPIPKASVSSAGTLKLRLLQIRQCRAYSLPSLC